MARARRSRALARAVLVALVAAGGAPVDATCAAGTWAKSVFYNYDESFDGVCVACIDDENYVLASATCPGGLNNFMCPAGYYNFYGPPSCVQCLSGTYKDTLSAAACPRCNAGYYMPNRGATGCIACIAGKFSEFTGRTSSNSCTDCIAGKSSPAGSSSCVNCAAGKFSEVVGASQCTDCTTGKYSSVTGAVLSSTCLNCAAGKSSPPGSGTLASCALCPQGTLSGAGGPCTECLAGQVLLSDGSFVMQQLLGGGVVAAGLVVVFKLRGLRRR